MLQEFRGITPWEREINHIATGMSPQPRGRLLPLHHGDGGDVVGGDGDHPGSAPPEFAPSNLQLLISISVFLYLRPPPHETPRGAIFIVIFRSRGSFGKKDQCKRSHEAQNDWSHAAQESGHMGLVVLALRPPLLRLFRSYAFFLPKSDPRKFSGHLDFVWVLETLKYRK